MLNPQRFIGQFKVILLIFCIAISYNANAQVDEKTSAKEAAAMFKLENYKGAAEVYQKLLTVNSQSSEYNYKIGVCYLKGNLLREEAATFLEKVDPLDSKYKDVDYYLAKAKMYQGKFDEAIDLFDKYRAGIKVKADDPYRVDLHLEWCANAKRLMEKPVDVKFVNIGEKKNTEYAEYNAVVDAEDSIMVFSSHRISNQGRQIDEKGECPSDLYLTVANPNNSAKVRNLGINVNAWFYEKILSMTPDGQTLLFSKQGEKGEVDLYMSTKAGRSFGKSAPVSEKFLTKYDEHNACLSPDGDKLFFAADIKGGYGGLDIYVCEKQSNGVWTDPQNLGPAINTAHNEDNPQLFIDGVTFFFSSEGHGSMGGMDVFMAKKPSEKEPWSKPVNLGYPVNDVYDNNDFFLTARKNIAYISAIRKDGFGDRDIYQIRFNENLVETKLKTVFIQIINPSGQVSKNTAVLLNKKNTGEKLGRIVTGSRGEMIQFLTPGDYGMVIKTRKLGQFEETISVPDNDDNKVKIQIKLKE